MTGRNVVVHIGLMKSGSTTLQRVAQASEGLHVADLGLVGDWQRSVKDGSWDAAAARFADIARAPDDWSGPVFLSHESLSTLHAGRLARTVSRVYAGATVLVVARSPIDYVRSIYQKRIRSGFAGDVLEFHAKNERNLLRVFQLDAVAAAVSRFGMTPMFLPLELLRDDREAFFSPLEAALGAPLAHDRVDVANATPRFESLEMLRAANGLFHALGETSPDLDPKEYAALSDAWGSRLGSLSDERLGELQSRFNIKSPEQFAAELDSIRDDVTSKAATTMTCLRDVPAFAPYLADYGLAT